MFLLGFGIGLGVGVVVGVFLMALLTMGKIADLETRLATTKGDVVPISTKQIDYKREGLDRWRVE